MRDDVEVVVANPARTVRAPNREDYVLSVAARSCQQENTRPGLLIVGESNPYGASPEYALYPDPPKSSGDRLLSMTGLSRDDYTGLWRTNLCRGTWGQSYARARARLLVSTGLWDQFVLLGAKVWISFYPMFFSSLILSKSEDETIGKALHTLEASLRSSDRVVAVLRSPHPSGRNPFWNKPEARAEFRRLFQSTLRGDEQP